MYHKLCLNVRRIIATKHEELEVCTGGRHKPFVDGKVKNFTNEIDTFEFTEEKVYLYQLQRQFFKSSDSK